MPQPSTADEAGEKFFVNIEGTIHPWDSSTITVPEIRKLAGWDATQQVVEVNLDDNTELTLADDATVTLKPGHGFAKKVKFQRG
jgi:Multiubiquitin